MPRSPYRHCRPHSPSAGRPAPTRWRCHWRGQSDADQIGNIIAVARRAARAVEEHFSVRPLDQHVGRHGPQNDPRIDVLQAIVLPGGRAAVGTGRGAFARWPAPFACARPPERISPRPAAQRQPSERAAWSRTTVVGAPSWTGRAPRLAQQRIRRHCQMIGAVKHQSQHDHRDDDPAMREPRFAMSGAIVGWNCPGDRQSRP
jgi:hypothetical protein